MKLQTIFRRVIKPAFLAEGEITVILKARVPGDLRAELNKLVKNLLALVRIHETALGDEFPGFLPQCAIRLFEIAAHLHQRLFLAAKVHCLRADEFLILLAQFRVLGFQRHVFRPEQRDVIFHIAIEHLVTRLRQMIELRMRDVNFFQSKLARLELRLDVFDEMQIRLLRIRIVRVARHRDVTARRLLVERGVELAPVQQPALQRGGILGLGGTPFELVEQRRDLRPVAEIKVLRHKRARPVRGQFFKRQ